MQAAAEKLCQPCTGNVEQLPSRTGDLQVVEILTDALTLSETPVPTKVARLFLVSDILHNSTAAVRNASRYRNHLEATLPDIFESFQVRHAVSEPAAPVIAVKIGALAH